MRTRLPRGAQGTVVANRRKQAAEWLVRLQDPDLTERELLRWEAWMKRSPRNRQAFGAMEELSRRLDEHRQDLKDIPLVSPPESITDSNVAGTSLLRKFANKPMMALRRARQGMIHWPRRTGGAVAAGAIAAIFAATVLLLPPGILGPTATQPVQSHHTSIAEHRTILLADGSTISMGAKSSLTVNFSAERRIVTLEAGEALFEVAVDARRPFIVVAGVGSIRALGTSFNVRRDDDRFVVTVTEGQVEVTRSSRAQRRDQPGPRSTQHPYVATLGVGEQAVVSMTQMSIHQLSDTAAVTDWRAGHLRFRAEPLKYVIAGVSRYTDTDIILVDAEIEDMLFTGTVYRDQVDDWLRALETVFPAEVNYVDSGRILIRKRIAGQED